MSSVGEPRESQSLLVQGEKALVQRDKLIVALRQNVASQLAAAIIQSAGQPHSPQEAVRIFRETYSALFS